MGAHSMRDNHPSYRQQTSTTCPRCDNNHIKGVPSVNPTSDHQWFECPMCDYMWSQPLSGDIPTALDR